MIERNHIYNLDVLEGLRQLPDNHVQCVVTSPPYWGLRDYGIDGQLGLEPTLDEYVAKMVEIFREVRRVLRPDGTLWLNMGDSYSGSGKGQWNGGCADPKNNKTKGMAIDGGIVPNGLKPKDLIGVPWRVAFALQADGWWLRSDIIWAKPNPMPESVTDRPTKSHEYIFLMSKSAKYFYDADAIRDAPTGRTDSIKHFGKGPHAKSHTHNYQLDGITGRNKRTVWTVATQPFSEAHFATYPEKLIEPCILAGCPIGGIVLDPFMGSGTTAVVAANNGRDWIGFELNAEYIKIAEKRIPARQEMLI